MAMLAGAVRGQPLQRLGRKCLRALGSNLADRTLRIKDRLLLEMFCKGRRLLDKQDYTSLDGETTSQRMCFESGGILRGNLYV